MRIVFRIVMPVNPIRPETSLNTNVMWDVRKALPVAPIGRVTDRAHRTQEHQSGHVTPPRGASTHAPGMALGSLVESFFEDGQALLGAFAQRIIAMAVFVLPRMQFVGNRHRGQDGDAD
jgi:hypothetical protein